MLNMHNWNLKTLSDRSSVPYETIKKIANAKIDKPSLSSISKIANAFQCSLDELAGNRPLNQESSESLNFLLLIETLSTFKQNFVDALLHPSSGLLPIICPQSPCIDGMAFSESSCFYYDFSSYHSRYGDHLLFAIKITNQSLHPLYPENSLLLIGDEPPAQKYPVGIYLRCKHLYIRTYQPGSPARLNPVTKKGSPIIIGRQTGWHAFGYVLNNIRSPF